ncbi:MAG: hypothetical protein PHH51_02205 [Bacilli bacterium]|nr:hypothetical protein [Bacilli bacterium]MDD3895673.1 hypothetical protein [Bacilli bacterium]MDD4407484.1 hypothetical protein [Bacilli bacterium]
MNINFYDYFNYSLSEDKLPHAFLIESNNINVTKDNIINHLFEKKLINNLDYQKNLNLILIEPDGKEIKSQDIQTLQERFSTLPVYNKYNVYVIKNAEKLNKSSANKLLKFLEEPGINIIGILLFDYNSDVLETIRSRCQYFLIKEQNLSADLENDISDLMDFINGTRNFNKEIDFKKKYSKFQRNALIFVFESMLNESEKLLDSSCYNIINVSKNINLIDKILRLLKSNVNIDLVLDIFFIELR